MRTKFLIPLALLALLMPLAACARPAADDPAADTTAGDQAATTDELVEGDGGEAQEADHGEEIAWFDGTVDEAFAAAAAERKPLFLYWGAEWCPPCHYLKVTTFHKPEFVAKSRDFISVYLDGDDERAQIFGEQFEVAGYPTVIIFNPDGEEVTRMSTGVPIVEYAKVLDVAKTMMVPMKDVLAQVVASGAANAAESDLDLLAFYAWDQDEKVEMPDEEAFDTFKALYEDTPPSMPVIKARFLAHFLNAAIDRAGDLADAAAEAEEAGEAAAAPEPVFTDEELAAHRAAVEGVLNTPELRAADLSFVQYWSRETAELLYPEPGAERNAFAAVWDAAAQALEDDETLSIDDRLTVMYPRLELARMMRDDAAAMAESDDGAMDGDDAAAEAEDDAATEAMTDTMAADVMASEGITETVAEGDAADADEAEADAAPDLPADLVAHVRDRVAWAGEMVTDESELQTVMSTMVWMLEEIGDDEAASALLEARMNDTLAPYYYMSWLAGKKADAGDTEGAITWYRRAYDEATGRYTRFRWGSTYLGQLLELAPDDVARIEADSEAIITEVMAYDDAFMLGNWSRLQTFGSKLETWNEDGSHDATVTKIRDLVHAGCDAFRAPDDTVPAEGEAVEGEGAAEAAGDEAAEGDSAEAPAPGAEAEPAGDTQYDRCMSFLADEDDTADE